MESQGGGPVSATNPGVAEISQSCLGFPGPNFCTSKRFIGCVEGTGNTGHISDCVTTPDLPGVEGTALG